MACDCRECAEGRIERYALRHGGEDWQEDYEELVPYKKPARSTWAGKRKRPCKKSKTGELCDFTVKKVLWQYWSKDKERWNKSYTLTCSRCGKHGPYFYDRLF